MSCAFDAFVSRAVGVPFEPFGRTSNGWDCWGTIYCAYAQVLDVELPSYDGCYSRAEAKSEIATLITGELGPWREVSKPEPMDVALMRIGGRNCHVGLVIGDRTMLHVIRGIDTCIEDFTGLRWRNRIAGVYRHDS